MLEFSWSLPKCWLFFFFQVTHSFFFFPDTICGLYGFREVTAPHRLTNTSIFIVSLNCKHLNLSLGLNMHLAPVTVSNLNTLVFFCRNSSILEMTVPCALSHLRLDDNLPSSHRPSSLQTLRPSARWAGRLTSSCGSWTACCCSFRGKSTQWKLTWRRAVQFLPGRNP